MGELNLPGGPGRLLSRGALEELSTLQSNLRSLSAPRAQALRLFLVSRVAATALAQQEFWLEFAWRDQEYRAAVRRLARFCLEHIQEQRPRAAGRAARRYTGVKAGYGERP